MAKPTTSLEHATGSPTGPLLTERETATRLKLTPKALQARRQRGDPPRYVKLGTGKRAPVRYPERWLDEDIAAGERRSTSQTAAA